MNQSPKRNSQVENQPRPTKDQKSQLECTRHCSSTMLSPTAARTDTPSTIGDLSSTRQAPNIALKTPFVHPTQSSDMFTTSATTYGYYGPSKLQYTYYISASDQKHPGFASCHAPGWNSLAPDEQRFVFSPGVCPSRWTAYSMGTMSATSTEIYSQAFCCARYGRSSPHHISGSSK